MTKYLVAVTALLLSASLTGCSQNTEPTPTVVESPQPTPSPEPAPVAEVSEEAEHLEATLPAIDINIGVLRGPTGLGMLGLMDEDQPYYHFSLMGAPDEIVPQIIQGNLDFAAVPANLASVLYNNTNGAIQVVAINTLGVLHLLDTTGNIQSIADLAGETVFLSGLGAVPEFAFNHVLRGHGLEPNVDVTLDFRSEHPEIAALMQGGYAQIALLPEPFATTVTLSVDDAQFAIDLTEAWQEVEADTSLVMGVLVARREFLETYPDAALAFLEAYERSIHFVNSDIPASSQLAVDFDIIPNPNVAAQAIPRSNIVFISGAQMEAYLNGFLAVLHEQAPPSVGGALPSEQFFFRP